MEGAQTIANIRGISLESEINQLTGREPDRLAAETRAGSNFWEEQSFVDAAKFVAKGVLGYFTGPIGPAIVTVAEQSTTDQGITFENLAPTLAKVAVSTIADSDLDFNLGLSLPEDTVGFFDDFGATFSSSFDSFGSTVSDYLGDVSFSDVLQVGTPLLTGLVSSGRPNMAAGGNAIRSAVPAIAGGAARAGAVVGRTFFNKFPNLATAIQKFRNVGQHVTRSQLYGMLKRFGPDFLITGGILTAAAVSELMVAGAGHRRMNPGNVKALRRSMRRLESFHHLCQKADKLRKPRARKKC